MPLNALEDRVSCSVNESDSEGETTVATSSEVHEEVTSPCQCCTPEKFVAKSNPSQADEDRQVNDTRTERRQRRKPLHPKKSPSLLDPNFRGVTLYFHTVVHGSSSELIITPFYSNSLSKVVRRRSRQRSSSECEAEHVSHEESTTSADEHPHSRPQQSTGAKCCASCGTRRTPLWRDAEDGTPLCNACGIRYRKYRLRCGQCWHIPRKDNKLFPSCSQCGGVLRFSQTRKQ